MSCSRAASWFFLCLLFAVSASFAQDTNSQATGVPANGSFSGSDFDSVQLNNGNLHIEIPMYSVGGRGLSVPVRLVYDSKGWAEYSVRPLLDYPVSVRTRSAGIFPRTSVWAFHNMDWALAGPLLTDAVPWRSGPVLPGYGLVTTSQPSCTYNGTATDLTYTSTYYEPNGTGHPFQSYALPGNSCNTFFPSSLASNDGTGYLLKIGSTGPTGVFAKDGTHFYQTVDQSGNVTGLVMEDSNGNQLKRAVVSNVPASTITDTLGRSLNVVPVLNNSTGKYELTYADTTGSPQTIQITVTTVNIQTSLCGVQNTFSQGPCTEASGSWQAPSVIQLPNGQQYTVTYVQNSHGQVSSVQLPTGATISYTWGSTDNLDRDDAGPKVTSRTVVSNGQSQTWNYHYTAVTYTYPVTTTAPDGNDTVHTFQGSGGTTSSPSYEVTEQAYQGPATSNVLLKTVQTVRQTGLAHLPLSITTTWNQQGGLVSRTEMDYDQRTGQGAWGNVIEKREYPFGVGNYGTLARKTDYQYAHLSGNTGYNVNYLNLNIANRVTETTVYDGSSTKLSDAKTAYDGTAVTTTSSVPNHDYTIGAFRGNATQTSVWLNTTNTWLPTNITYNDLGHVLTTQDPGLHTTTFLYTDSWTPGATCGVGTNTQAYLTQTSAPDTVNSLVATVHHRAQTTYYPCTGQKQATKDENDILAARAGTTYTYDLMLRPLTVTHTDGGTTTMSYGDSPNAISVTTSTKQDATHNIVSTSYHDGLGRVKQTQLVDPTDGDTFVDTTYDLMGRVATVTNPYRGSPCTPITTCETQYQYDALGRKTLEILPDGSLTSNNVKTAYGAQTTAPIGLSTTVTDQASKKRMSVTDALGRLVDVWEPSATSNTLVNETLYTYDLLNNLLRVDQKGNTTNTALWRTRTSTYDSLSRLLTSSNPESGLITWTYDVDSNFLTKKDALNHTITYNYDQLHRVATVGATHAKSYSTADHFVDYFFDQTSYNSLTIAEGVGHQTGMADATGSSASTFDTEGRVLSENQTINITGVTPAAVTKALTYTYNLDGSMATLVYPGGRTVKYAYNTAGHAVSAIDSATPIKYVTSATYAPHGDVASYINGLASTFAGIQTTNTWNNRFQPQSFVAATLGTGAHNVMSLNFNFNQGTVGAPIDNGVLVKITNNVNTGRNTNYLYDQLNRITAGWHDATDWGTQYTVDIWGNLTQKAPCNNTVGCPTRTMGEAFSAGANGNNQFNTYSYDASGNLLNDLLGHTFVYDAENRPSSETQGSTTVSYYYDGEGERVAKSSGKLYLFGTNSAPLVETDASGATTAQYIFFNGKRVAMRLPDNSAHYYFADQIGSANVLTNATGTVEQDIEYHPYGEQQVYVDATWQEYRFTGHEHDPETNNDYFGARYYSSTFGRFLTPDWSATPAPIPYAAMGNPQTLNLYSYVENNPITGTDPDGHCGNGDAGCTPEQQAADAKKAKEDARLEAEFKAWLAKAIEDLESLGAHSHEFLDGVKRGGISSMSVGLFDGPREDDSGVSRLGQTVGTLAEGTAAAYVAGTGAVETFGALVTPGGQILTPVTVIQTAIGGVGLYGALQNFNALQKPNSSASSGSSSGRAQAQQGMTSGQATQAAGKLGYRPAKNAPFNSHGKKVFTNGKNFISADRGGHIGGVWKMFSRRGERMGTFDANLKPIGN